MAPINQSVIALLFLNICYLIGTLFVLLMILQQKQREIRRYKKEIQQKGREIESLQKRIRLLKINVFANAFLGVVTTGMILYRKMKKKRNESLKTAETEA